MKRPFTSHQKPPRRDERRKRREQKRNPYKGQAAYMAVTKIKDGTFDGTFCHVTIRKAHFPLGKPFCMWFPAEESNGRFRPLHSISGMEQNDDDIDLMPPTQRTISAATATPLHPAGPRSVFELDACPLQWQPMVDKRPVYGRRIERDIGIVRCITFPYADTVEAIEAEQARRARQKPPPPTARFLKAGHAARSAKQTAMFHAAPVYA